MKPETTAFHEWRTDPRNKLTTDERTGQLGVSEAAFAGGAGSASERLGDALETAVRWALRGAIGFRPNDEEAGKRARKVCDLLVEMGRMELEGDTYCWTTRPAVSASGAGPSSA